MSKYLLLLVFITNCFTFIHAQPTPTFEWVDVFVSSFSDEPKKLTKDNDGNLIVIGTYYGSTDFDPGSGSATLTTTDQRAYIAKYTKEGVFIWVKEILSSNGNFIADVTIDNLNNIYVCGLFDRNADLDPGTGALSVTAPGYAAYMLKLTPAGDLIYAYAPSPSLGFNRFNKIAINATNEVYLSYSQNGIVDYDTGSGVSIYDNSAPGSNYEGLLKINSSGNFMWRKDFKLEVSDLIMSPTENPVLYGSYYAIIDLDPGVGVVNSTLTSGSLSGLAIVTLDTSGEYVSHFCIENNDYYIEPNVMALSEAGNSYIISGYFTGETDFDPSTGTDKDSALFDYDGFIASYDLTGVLQWKYIVNAVSSTSLLIDLKDLYIDSNDDIYLSGLIDGGYDMDASADTALLDPDAWNNTGFLLKINASGQYQWAYNYSREVRGIVLSDDTYSIYTYGLFEGSTNFDPVDTVLAMSTVGNDTYLLKWNNCEIDTTITQSFFTYSASESEPGTTYQWFDCITGDTLVGETDSSFTATVNGTYQVQINKGGCSFTSACFIVNTLDINDYDSQNLLVYPNPTNEIITIQMEKPIGEIIVQNTLGEIVLTHFTNENRFTLPLNKLPAGIYTLVMNTKDQTLMKKIIKN